MRFSATFPTGLCSAMAAHMGRVLSRWESGQTAGLPESWDFLSFRQVIRIWRMDRRLAPSCSPHGQKVRLNSQPWTFRQPWGRPGDRAYTEERREGSCLCSRPYPARDGSTLDRACALPRLPFPTRHCNPFGPLQLSRPACTELLECSDSLKGFLSRLTGRVRIDKKHEHQCSCS